ncbi:MAG TPA: ImmA/IrrE family metallo-endopeptidase [Blastocatellia bacterium]
MPPEFWTNPSVLALSAGSNPVEVMTQRARATVTKAIEAGLKGPPFDPLDLATYMGASVVPREDIRDARVISVAGRPVIEFNPNRPRGRVRYSISHELAHLLFADWRDKARSRSPHGETEGDDWQLEMLCNIGAAELLMPIGSFGNLENEPLSVDHLMELRRVYDTSTEALFIRIARLTRTQCSVFVASPRDTAPKARAYKVDYAIPSRTWPKRIPSGLLLPKDSVVNECTAIGFTAKGKETWGSHLADVEVECVGVPPYPGRFYPRVVGVVKPTAAVPSATTRIRYLRGDARKPHGRAVRIVAHIVNDKTPRWGAGFALQVAKKWPTVQDEFIEWSKESRDRLALGSIQVSGVEPSLILIQMVSQHGYGPSAKPRIRYQALHSCLQQLTDIAITKRAQVHMPRIGCGQAGGSWEIVKELINETLCASGVAVTVYDPPDAEVTLDPQGLLDFTGRNEIAP